MAAPTPISSGTSGSSSSSSSSILIIVLLLIMVGLVGVAMWNNSASSSGTSSSSGTTSALPSSSVAPSGTSSSPSGSSGSSTASGSSSQVPTPTNPFAMSSQQLVNGTVYPQYCMDITGMNKGVIYPLELWQCKPSGSNANQLWTYNPTDGSIKSNWSGLCLDVYGAGTAAGTNVGLYTCTGSPQQQWTYDTTSGNLSPKNAPGMCIDISPVSTGPSSGTLIGGGTVLASCNDANLTQHWYVK